MLPKGCFVLDSMSCRLVTLSCTEILFKKSRNFTPGPHRQQGGAEDLFYPGCPRPVYQLIDLISFKYDSI